MTFATDALAEALDMVAVSPFRQESFLRWVSDEVGVEECIAEMPIELSPQPLAERTPHTAGKACLRFAFPDSGSAFRRKDPIEMGSGCSHVHMKEHFGKKWGVHADTDDTDENTDNAYDAEVARVLLQEGVKITYAEQLFYYAEFKKVFPKGLDPEEVPRFGSDPCALCGYQLRSADEMFCHVCGAWPARV
jgi:asparagine synthase (glutamine-hydrolysing)